MKTLLICLLLTGYAYAEPVGKPLVEDCVLQIIKQVSDTIFVVRQHCEPEGDAT
jgi:hypothetical protein